MKEFNEVLNEFFTKEDGELEKRVGTLLRGYKNDFKDRAAKISDPKMKATAYLALIKKEFPESKVSVKNLLKNYNMSYQNFLRLAVKSTLHSDVNKDSKVSDKQMLKKTNQPLGGKFSKEKEKL